MSKTNFNGEMPILGQPVFRISENSLAKKMKISSSEYGMNALVYFAADAIRVDSQEWEDETMTRIVLNKGLKSVEDNNVSLEIRYDPKKNGQKGATAEAIFVDEEAAQAVARKLNENQKEICGGIIDSIKKLYHEYDSIIALCTVTPNK